eukprot:3847756-Prymnesium_polylepis.1
MDVAGQRVQHAMATRSTQLYDLFYLSGLRYGTSFRQLFVTWTADSGSLGQLRPRARVPHIGIHPADLDA